MILSLDFYNAATQVLPVLLLTGFIEIITQIRRWSEPVEEPLAGFLLGGPRTTC